MSTFEDLVAEGAAVPTEGWDFSWFTGRATEQRPSWGYSKLLADRMAKSEAALDTQTGGGEVLASVPVAPPLRRPRSRRPLPAARCLRSSSASAAPDCSDRDNPSRQQARARAAPPRLSCARPSVVSTLAASRARIES